MLHLHRTNIIWNILFVSLIIFKSSSWGKIILLVNDISWARKFEEGIRDYESDNRGTPVSFKSEAVIYRNESDWEQVCQLISNGVTVVLDFTFGNDYPEANPRKFFIDADIPFYRVDVPTDALIKGSDAMLQAKRASNGFLIFHTENDVDRGIHDILGHTLIRYAFLNAVTMSELIKQKFEYRIPSAVVLYGKSENFNSFTSENEKIVKDRMEWVFMSDTFQNSVSSETLNLSFPYISGTFDPDLCCKLQTRVGLPCNPSTCNGVPSEEFAKKLGYILSDALTPLNPTANTNNIQCTGRSNKGKPEFNQQLEIALSQKNQDVFEKSKLADKRITIKTNVNFVEIYPNETKKVGQYSLANLFNQDETFAFRTRKPYYRIGIVDFSPWTFRDNESESGWGGYCIKLAKGIADKMNFTYDLVESDGFGRRDNVTGVWDGLTGDLIHGKIDIAVAAYIMTSEREEFIDFVSPYYEQSGLLITMKRPDAKNSLFKFMTVLRAEVWLSIAGATVSTGLMLWFLDKFSPYSAQNNPHKYKTFRKFTLKESFWFALTSFTPQGGGEPPRAFSGRTLVAAYWIFEKVVLMLATFTANLAAFLTVERMQSPIRNLEHLAAQSSVKYTVAKNSTAMNFFKNMANAEEILYQMWRNLTLSAPSSAKEYIVWEYPIREMYIHIYSVINKSEPVDNYEDGFNKALNDDYFAFIHDAAQTKYHVYRHCNLTLIGESFAEAPYAIAVAQGNPLQDNISMAILQLQTARYFEQLSTEFWTSKCPSLGDEESDGISLESLGGVFIATIIGLGIAFISLAIEVFTTARNRRKAKIEADNMIKPNFVGPLDFYGATKKSEVFHRGHFLPEVIN